MDENRRNFLKIAGCSAMGVAWGIPVIRAIGKAFEAEPAPGALAGKRWGLAIDIQKCMSVDVARACQRVCHQLHNVPKIDDPEEEIKWIWTEKYDNAFPDKVHEFSASSLKGRPVMVLCNHCERPSCVRVCPTQATWKREDGVVMMDMHRCIGCRYCIVACPYGSRSFNWSDPRPNIKPEIDPEFPTRSQGVVEKCNLCAERLAKGLGPACVDAANQVAGGGAMYFGDVGDPNSEIVRVLRSRHSLQRRPHLGTQPHVFYLV
jgi:molybdopterin-containing oxidoreductase family iron-sulfur binding subunit